MSRDKEGKGISGRRPLDMPNWLKPEQMDFEKRRILNTAITPHTTIHEEGGEEEISIEGLEGEPYELKKLKEDLYLKDMASSYDKLVSHEMHASDRRGFEIR